MTQTQQAQHTPGPWQASTFDNEGEPFSRWFIETVKESALGTSIIVDGQTDSSPEGLANAALIASAPEMLSALEWYAELFEVHPTDFALDYLRKDGGKVARKAIARARLAIVIAKTANLKKTPAGNGVPVGA